MAAKPSERLTSVVDVVQKTAAVVADLKAEIVLKDKQIQEAKAKAATLRAEIAALESKKNAQPSEAFSGVMSILKAKYN